MRQLLLCLPLFLCSAAASAEVFDFNIGSDSFRLNLNGELRRLFSVDSGRYDVGVLSKRGDDNQTDIYQGHLGVLIAGDAGATNADVRAGLGVRLMIADVDPSTGGAVALGGEFEARIPQFNRLGVFGYAYGAPRATSLGDLNRYTEIAVAIDYQLIREASIYLGYRNVKYGLDKDPQGDDTRTRDTGIHGGLRLTF